MLDSRVLSVTLSTALALAAPAGAQCVGTLLEDQTPAAFAGVSLADPGLKLTYWSWDELGVRRNGHSLPSLVETGDGILLAALEWPDADVCSVGGTVERTAVLLEALDERGFGRWAVVNLATGAVPVDVDLVQDRLGGAVSRLVPVPEPRVTRLSVSPDEVVVALEWTLDRAGEALSDLADGDGWPLPTVRGAAVYVINGPAATSRPWDWSFARDRQGDASNGFSTDQSAEIHLPRDLWSDVTVSFAVALTFDGNGDAEGELPDSRSVHGKYLGHPTRWLRLPALEHDRPVAVVGLEAIQPTPTELITLFHGQAEPTGASYRLWLRHPGRPPRLLASVPGEGGDYRMASKLPPWCRWPGWSVAVEMLDGDGRVVDTATAVPSRP